jgi:hypothetical protein
MDTEWASFEERVARVLRAKGFVADVTQTTSDGGIDVIAYRQEPLLRGKYVVQCKNWSNPVGVSVVRDLYGAMTHERANKGILITTSSFTQAAIEFAVDKPLELVDGPEWRELVNEVLPVQVSGTADESRPRMTDGVEKVVNTFDNLAIWARRKMRELDDLQDKEPICAPEYADADLASSQYRHQYAARTGDLYGSLGDTFSQVLDCIRRLTASVNQLGWLKGFKQTSESLQVTEHYVSRYKHLIERLLGIYKDFKNLPTASGFRDFQELGVQAMYHGLSATLCGFMQTPTKQHDGKAVHLTLEAPQDLHDHHMNRYTELNNAAANEFKRALTQTEHVSRKPGAGRAEVRGARTSRGRWIAAVILAVAAVAVTALFMYLLAQMVSTF